jgi:hypothetical protein
MNEELLRASLLVAVPLWVLELGRMSAEDIMSRCRACAAHIAEHGDIILYKSKKGGGSAEAFNRLAEGLACLSFAPGGVKFLGLHFDNGHEEMPK